MRAHDWRHYADASTQRHAGKEADLAHRCGGPPASPEFWSAYLQLLPQSEDLCQPFCLGPRALDEFQHRSSLFPPSLAPAARRVCAHLQSSIIKFTSLILPLLYGTTVTFRFA